VGSDLLRHRSDHAHRADSPLRHRATTLAWPLRHHHPDRNGCHDADRGFDGVTTLAEDVVNPKRNVMLATVLVCLFTGVAGGLQVYLGQRVWPDYSTFPQLEIAFMDVGVNVATFRQFTVLRRSDRKRQWFADALIPLVGFVFCLWIWLGLKTPAKVVGGIWLLAGLLYSAIRSRGFRTQPVMIDFSET
jgi:amino acid transporter